jgi:hypothetical protein
MKSLGKQNRLLFNEMLRDYQENKEYIKAIDTKGKSYSAESCIWLKYLSSKRLTNTTRPLSFLML